MALPIIKKFGFQANTAANHHCHHRWERYQKEKKRINKIRFYFNEIPRFINIHCAENQENQHEN
jgi:hypothetical protein